MAQGQISTRVSRPGEQGTSPSIAAKTRKLTLAVAKCLLRIVLVLVLNNEMSGLIQRECRNISGNKKDAGKQHTQRIGAIYSQLEN